MLGGYQVIDCKGVVLTSTPVTIKGAFKKAKSGKAILIENMGGVSGFFYDIAVDATDYALIPLIVITDNTPTIANITITNEDACTLNVGE